MRKLPALAVICLAIVAVTPAPGPASELAAMVRQSASGSVTVNFLTWYAFPTDLEFAAIHDVEALDVIRRDLAARRRIRDLPILIWGPPRERSDYRVALEDDCEAGYTPNSGRPENSPYAFPLGDCYEITVRETSLPFRDTLAMAIALSELSAAVTAMEIADLTAFREGRAARIKPYEDIVLHFDPIWSPDGARLLYTTWKNGTVGFELLEAASGVVTQLDPLEDSMAARPIWSDDARFIAYAGPAMVRVYDVRTGTTRTFRPAAGSGSRARTMIEFKGNRLRFAFDVNFLGGYDAYTYDASQGTLERLAEASVRPFGDEAFDWDRHASLQPVRGPDGKWIAMFTFVSGQRRVKVEALR